MPEPPAFDEKARKPGKKWLAAHHGQGRPRDYWTPFKAELADGFKSLCAYHAMLDRGGTVDHYQSVKAHPELAYEWQNYRFASALMNQVKKDAVVLDPYEVGEDWFEIDLPSLEMRVTDKVPPESRALAVATLRRLRLDHGEAVIRYRQSWYEMYEQGDLKLDRLYKVAPLIAKAVEKRNRERGRAAREAMLGRVIEPAASPGADEPTR